MGTIAGIVSLSGEIYTEEKLIPFVQGLQWRDPGKLALARSGPCIFLMEYPPPSDTPLLITADCRLDNGTDLMRELGTTENLLASAWEKWRRETVHRLEGDFSVAVWDCEKQQLIAVRDRFGVKPFYYAHTDEFFAFASTPTALLQLAKEFRSPNEHMIAEYLLSTIDAPNAPSSTYFKQIHKLPPASMLTLKNGEVHVNRYWDLDPNTETKRDSDEAYVEGFLEHLKRAVNTRIPGSGKVGSCLSGGLDSSSLAATCRDALDSEKFAVYFLQSNVVENDESRWVDAVVAQGGYLLRRCTPNSPLFDVDTLLELLGGPYAFDNLDEDWALIQRAGDDGMDALFSGYYGDVTVSAMLDYLLDAVQQQDWEAFFKQAHEAQENSGNPERDLFWYYGAPRLEALAKRFSWLQFMRAGRQLSRQFGIGKAEILWHLWLRPITPKPIRRLYREVTGSHRPVWWELNRLINEDLADQLELESRARHMKESWSSPMLDAKQNHHEHILAGTTSLSLEHLEAMGAVNGVEVQFPFLDQRLVEYCYGLPRDLHGRDGFDRWIMRKAMKGLLPDEVRWRRQRTEYSATISHGRKLDLVLMDDVYSAQDLQLWNYIDRSRLLEEWNWFRSEECTGLDEITIGHRLWRAAVLGIWLRSSEA